METEVNTSKRDPFYVLGVPESLVLSPVEQARREAVRKSNYSQGTPYVNVALVYYSDIDAVEPYHNGPAGTLTRAEFDELVAKVRRFYSHMPSDAEIMRERLGSFVLGRNTSSYLHTKKQIGFVYLLQSSVDCFKIGVTKNDPRGRVVEIERQLNQPIDVVHQFISDDIFWAENQLHQRFEKKLIPDHPQGHEWFRLNTDDLEFIVRIERFEDGAWIVREPPL